MGRPKDQPSRRYKGVYYRDLKSGDRSYYLIMRIDGKQRRVSMGRRSEGITEAFCYQQKAHILNTERYGEEEARILQKRRKSDPTFREMYDDFIANSSIKPSSRRVFGYSLRGITFWDRTRVSVDDVLEFQKYMLDRVKPNTVNARLNMLSAVFSYAIDKESYRHENPVMKVKRSIVDDKRLRYLSRDEVDLLLEEVKDDEHLHLFTRLALSTGARISTLMQVRAEDVKGDTVSLQNIKASGHYIGYLDDATKDLLRGRAGYVLALDGEEIRPKEYQYQYRMQLVLDRLFNEGVADQDRVVIHTLRHTTASLMVQRGVPLHVVQKVMDHSTIRSTERYAKLHPDNVRDAVGKFWED